MKIHVVPKRTFNNIMADYNINDDNVESHKDTFFISINDTKSSAYYEDSWFKKDHDNVKVLYFDDVENEYETSPTNTGKCTPFSEKMAQDLYDFILKNLDKKLLIVSCVASISRSPSVGLFVNDLVGNSYNEFMIDNPQSRPNARVTRLLNRVHRLSTHNE